MTKLKKLNSISNTTAIRIFVAENFWVSSIRYSKLPDVNIIYAAYDFNLTHGDLWILNTYHSYTCLVIYWKLVLLDGVCFRRLKKWNYRERNESSNPNYPSMPKFRNGGCPKKFWIPNFLDKPGHSKLRNS